MVGMTSNIRRLVRVLELTLAVWTVVVIALIAAIMLYSRTDRAQSADVIVVLGAGLQGRDRPGPALVRRTAQGAELWRQGLAQQIICTGGYGPGKTRSEADACASLLRDQGVPGDVILLEDRSRSTEENAIYTLEAMQANGWQTALVVSDGYHLLRANWIFSHAGIENFTSPADAPSFFNLLSSTLREVVAFHWLVFKTVFNIPVTYVAVL